ncbi:MAG: 16S rRNA (cytidine(1402)-2'-O)-methyltransferase [Proteobacteria bacterium]|nr:16S rRNA (cytidine(1402)-2'-O)-methyltransferase [Pseudomonadota bacterium]MBU1737302.1 16S rRNA (cytidine(1402)-2'-O)-methyltransferase [Pseudomonadota bacterium]
MGAGVLYVVATPIGNLEDITRRAVRILGEVNLIAAEDTRHTRKLLASLGIRTPMISYYKDKEQSRASDVIQRILSGENVALVSDAGTPAISDPGAVLVRLAVENGVRVVPVPGPSALSGAVSIAGLKDNAFVFLGFLPGRKGERVSLLKSIEGQNRAHVFYESPHRIVKSLQDCLEVLGDRRVFIGRELTKLHEETIHAKTSEVIEILTGRDKIRGEFVVVIDGSDESGPGAMQGVDLDGVLVWYRDNSRLSMRDAVRKVAEDLGTARSEVYSTALVIWKKGRKG